MLPVLTAFRSTVTIGQRRRATKVALCSCGHKAKLVPSLTGSTIARAEVGSSCVSSMMTGGLRCSEGHGLPDVKVGAAAERVQTMEPVRILLPHAVEDGCLPQHSPRRVHVAHLNQLQHNLQPPRLCSLTALPPPQSHALRSIARHADMRHNRNHHFAETHHAKSSVSYSQSHITC